MQQATQKLNASQAELDKANAALAEQSAAVKTIAVALAEKGQVGGKGGTTLPTLPDNPSSLTVADLQSELKKHGLDTDWDPAKGKSVLVDRLTVRVLSNNCCVFCISVCITRILCNSHIVPYMCTTD